jgi:polysaccharide biosynthesis transport protein
MNIVAPITRANAATTPRFGELRDVGTETSPLIRQYLRIAMRWRYVIGGVIIACVILALIATLLMTPKYTAEALVEISRESDKITNFQGADRESGLFDQEFYQTQYGLLRSRALSERVATKLRLVDDPAFFKRFGVTSTNPAFQLAADRFPPSGRAERVRTAGEVLLKNLTVAPARLSRLVAIRFTSPDSALSARIANAWAENFIQTNLERKVQATSYGRDLLQRQLALQKERLDETQRQLVAYASEQRIINLPAREGSDGKTTSERSMVADELATISGALSQATTDRIQAEARYSQAGRSGASSQALENLAINSLRQRRAELAAEYQRLMVQFEPGYPAARAVQTQIDQLDRSIAREEARVSGALEASYRESIQRERALKTKVDQLKNGYLDLRRRSIQYNIYQQEVDTNRALYDGLLQRFKEIGVAGGVGVNNVSVVDPADAPDAPSSPRVLLNLIVGLLVGLGLGALVALALEQLDEAIGDPAEVERRLGLPLLGSVPRVTQGSPEDALRDRKSELVDAYLAIQTNLAFTTEHGVPRSLAVTSTRPAEGKSTTALALATSLARAKRKVILIDGDMRAPSVHILGKVKNERGLSNFLSGDDQLEEMTFPMQEFDSSQCRRTSDRSALFAPASSAS